MEAFLRSVDEDVFHRLLRFQHLNFLWPVTQHHEISGREDFCITSKASTQYSSVCQLAQTTELIRLHSVTVA